MMKWEDETIVGEQKALTSLEWLFNMILAHHGTSFWETFGGIREKSHDSKRITEFLEDYFMLYWLGCCSGNVL